MGSTVSESIASGAKALTAPAVRGAQIEDTIRSERPNLYKSFLLTRLLVGIVGIALPTFIIIWDLVSDVTAKRPLALRDSLSAYYYHSSPLGDWFVGCLWAVGVGLMVYMGTRKSSFANLVTCVAGFAALAVSLFPTNDVGAPPSIISTVHFVAAAVVILGLGIICWGFGIDDNVRTDANSERKAARRGLHYGAAIVILVCVAFVPLNSALAIWPEYGVLAAELVAVYAFATSWFVKGAELGEYSRRHPAAADDGLAPLPGVPASPSTVNV